MREQPYRCPDAVEAGQIADEMMEEQAETLTAAGQAPSTNPVDVNALRDSCDGCVWRTSTLQCLRALIRKRCQYARHQWALPVLGIFAPCLLLGLQGYRERSTARAAVNLTDVYHYDIMAMYNFSVASMLTSDEESVLISQYYRQLIEQKGVEVTRVRDVTDYLLEVGIRSLDEYMKYVVGASFLLVGKKKSTRADPSEGVVQLGLSKDYEGRLAIAWYSGEFYHSAILALNLVHTSLLRWTVGDDTASIKLRVRPQKNLEESVEYDKDSPEVIQRQLERFTLGAMSLATLTAGCGLFPVLDRVSGSRQLQLLTGISVPTYWLANFIFDYFLYTLSTICIYMLMFWFYGTFFREMMQPVVLVFACYGLSAFPLGYLLSLGANTPSAGYALVLLLSFFGAFMTSGTIAAELLKTAAGIRFVLLNLLPLLRLLPSFAFMSAFLQTVSKSQLAWICSRYAVALAVVLAVLSPFTSRTQLERAEQPRRNIVVVVETLTARHRAPPLAREHFLQRQAQPVHLIFADSDDATLDHLAKLADNIYEAANPFVSAVGTTPEN
ncbi:hypothetical protein HPB49_019030 [Dermacentor silvarum]|uniref:Uncharacterized protein n=1 Tax=Dermacentor silvarum TaxID=543639 RepID=A0ACB8CGS5_DERSI|nr:hypothetical protein HPB49_019030 [Dermacentor silvarum]